MTETKRGPGRPKGSKNKPKPDVIQGGGAKLKGPGTAGPGHNKPPVLTDEQRKALFLSTLGQYERLLEKKDSVVVAIRNLANQAKADGIPKKDLDEAVKLKKAEVAEVAEKQRRRAEIAQWLGLGVQLDFFDADPDRKPLDERAEEAGFEAGARGDPCETTFVGDQRQAWVKGWHRGEAARKEAIAKVTGEELEQTDAFVDRRHAERVRDPEEPLSAETLADAVPTPAREQAEEVFATGATVANAFGADVIEEEE